MNWQVIRAWHKFLQRTNPRYVEIQIKNVLNRYFPRESLTNINLSLSSICSSDCIFCPAERGANAHQKIMKLTLVEKIVREVKSKFFCKNHNVQIFSIGENGDAFLNKDAISILRLIRRELPHVKILCFTNFRTLTPDIIDIILKENLLYYVGCNIDGASDETYHAVKRTDFKKVMEHLNYFIANRRKWRRDIPLGVGMLTLFAYVHAIQNNFGCLPLKYTNRNIKIADIKDDAGEIKKVISPLLDHPKDRIFVTPPFGWAERSAGIRQKINYARYRCPNLARIKREAFIAPDGLWYACCYDANNELALGDVDKQSINEIFWSEKRRNLIQQLEEKEFQKIGGPCLTVNCCQKLSPP